MEGVAEVMSAPMADMTYFLKTVGSQMVWKAATLWGLLAIVSGVLILLAIRHVEDDVLIPVLLILGIGVLVGVLNVINVLLWPDLYIAKQFSQITARYK